MAVMTCASCGAKYDASSTNSSCPYCGYSSGGMEKGPSSTSAGEFYQPDPPPAYDPNAIKPVESKPEEPAKDARVLVGEIIDAARGSTGDTGEKTTIPPELIAQAGKVGKNGRTILMLIIAVTIMMCACAVVAFFLIMRGISIASGG
ncbi:MAG TPA: hypothetical protein VN376_02845 [Longilinea sp.]|nr:hypothetical protein [Longilinea sp.]